MSLLHFSRVFAGSGDSLAPPIAPSVSASRIDDTTIRFTFTGGSGAASWAVYYRTPSGSGGYTSQSVSVGVAYYDVTVSSQSTADLYIAATNGAGTVNSDVATGSAASGASLTINGAGFGTKSAAAPFFWNPFSTNNGSTDMAGEGYASAQLGFGANAYGSTASIDTAAGRGTGKGALKLTMSFSGAGDRDYFPHLAVDSSNQGRGAMNSQQLWFSFWFKLVRTSGTDTARIQIKGPRAGYAPSTSTDYYSSPPRFTPSYYVQSNGYGDAYMEVVRSDGVPDGAEHFSSTSPNWSASGWNFIEGWLKLNDIGSSNGFCLQRINGVDITAGFPDNSNSRAITARISGETSKLFTFMFLIPGLDLPGRTASCAYQAFFAEHFIDTTSQRVVITDNLTYGSSTKWAVQPCTSWSDTSVLISTPNYAGFTSGQTAYAHVFGTNNTVVATQSITVP